MAKPFEHAHRAAQAAVTISTASHLDAVVSRPVMLETWSLVEHQAIYDVDVYMRPRLNSRGDSVCHRESRAMAADAWSTSIVLFS